ncbi:hypothetical protein K1719_040871 [Acacia pycnantha]|nr:hypothetical protein K1719_040871 [Acacia pycnantha]
MFLVSIPTWFTVDTKLGCLSVHLDAPQCFSAEMYSADLNIVGKPEVDKVALLDLVVRKEERSGFREAHVASIDVKIIMKKQ